MTAPTVHCLAVQVVPSVNGADLVLEFLVWIRDLPDLVFVVDEVPTDDLAAAASDESTFSPE